MAGMFYKTILAFSKFWTPLGQNAIPPIEYCRPRNMSATQVQEMEKEIEALCMRR